MDKYCIKLTLRAELLINLLDRSFRFLRKVRAAPFARALRCTYMRSITHSRAHGIEAYTNVSESNASISTTVYSGFPF